MDQIINNPRVAETISDQARNCASPQELREKVIDFIVKWPQTLSNLLVAKNNMITAIRESKNLPPNYPEEIIWQQYLLPKHAESGVFAEDIIIQCIPSFLSKDMYVISPGTSEGQPNQTKWLHIPSFAGTSGPPITLASSQISSMNEKHFQSLIPAPTVASGSMACRNCAKLIKKNIRSHLNQSKMNCWNMYDKEWMDQEAKIKTKEKKARYNAKNQQQISKKQADYNAKHREEIKIKQAKYDSKHREEIKIKQAKYESKHREEIKIKQAKYNKNHREEIRIKQAKYNAEHREQIRKNLQDYREMYINKRKSKRQIIAEMPWDKAAGWQLQQYKP